MHKAMKALTLALVAAAAGRAQADLVVSALFGTEPPSYVHAAVTNVLSFTLPTTKIVGPDRILARRAHQPEPSFAAAAAALRARNASGFAYGFGTNSTKKTKRLHNATAIRKKVPWYRRHGHANATLARRHRGNATGFLRHRRHANATRLHHRRHPRRHNRDGLGAPTPGDAVDGVVVAAPAPHERIERTGISSGLEALAALHRKGALTDSEFAAAKAKLLLLLG